MTTKLSKSVYNKIVLQAEEARELGFTKLANNVLSVVGAAPRDEEIIYNEYDLIADADAVLWKIAMNVIAYHDLKSVDIQKIEEVIDELGVLAVSKIENILGVAGDVGKLEEKLIGQK